MSRATRGAVHAALAVVVFFALDWFIAGYGYEPQPQFRYVLVFALSWRP